MQRIIGIKSGTFTILTKAHLKCLKFCKEYCDELIVVINDDDYLKQKKGFCAVPAKERRETLLELPWISEVIVYSGPNEQKIVETISQKYQPPEFCLTMFHALETHSKEFIPGADIADRVIFCPQYESLSTSDIINRINGAT